MADPKKEQRTILDLLHDDLSAEIKVWKFQLKNLENLKSWLSEIRSFKARENFRDFIDDFTQLLNQVIEKRGVMVNALQKAREEWQKIQKAQNLSQAQTPDAVSSTKDSPSLPESGTAVTVKGQA